MIKANLPADEASRLLDLYSFDILDSAAENDFDGLVELASQICKCPVSLISLLDKDRQWFKAKKGLEEESTSRDVAFCSHAILQSNVMVVEDATKDERFFDNPLVKGDLNIRFYAGAPILSPNGHKMGTVCIIDHTPRTLSAEEERALKLLSEQVTKLLEIKQKNLFIRKQAEEAIVLKSRTIKLLMDGAEEDRLAIAANLHEELAQELASGILLLTMAEKQPNNSLIHVHTAKEQLQQTLNSMRRLTANITPLSAGWFSPEEVIAEFIERTAATYPFKITVDTLAEQKSVDTFTSLTAIRLMDQWLKNISQKRNITEVKISVIVNRELILRITDNGLPLGPEAGKTKLFEHVIDDKVQAYGGSVKLSVSSANENAIAITLPLQASDCFVVEQAAENIDVAIY